MYELPTVVGLDFWEASLPPLVLVIDLAEIRDKERLLGVGLVSQRKARCPHDAVSKLDIGMSIP